MTTTDVTETMDEAFTRHETESMKFWEQATAVLSGLQRLLDKADSELVASFFAEMARNIAPNDKLLAVFQLFSAGVDCDKPLSIERKVEMLHLGDMLGSDWIEVFNRDVAFMTKNA